LATEIITNAHQPRTVHHAGLFTSSYHNSFRSGSDWPGKLQSCELWFEVVIYVIKNLPGTQHKPSV